MPGTFADQCRRADVMYFHGGDDHLLKYWMRQFDLAELFAGKVVATLKAVDYEVIFQDTNGRENRIIRFRPFGDPKTKREELF